MINSIIIGKELLETITTALYEDPIILFREYVQNSVDAYKFAVKEDGKVPLSNFCVSIDIDKTERKIVIKDNGYGIYTNQEFQEKMISFANSRKQDRSLYIGFRGIGRISAMPFCGTLTFINKAEGTKYVNICRWEGYKYRELLNSTAKDYESFEEIVKEIVDITEEKTNDDIADHYFKVIIDNYTLEVDEVIMNESFEQKLKKMLPLKYSDDFTTSKEIIEKYNAFMEEDLNDFMYSVVLNGKDLRKNYSDSKNVLESDIVFWEIRGKSNKNDRPGEKIGIMWFTFNRKIEAVQRNKKNLDYGVLIRSKNVLMGNNDTFAELCFNSKEYISTYRELTQTLRGIYGELLINSASLRDNARREWFKTDENSYHLKGIIIDFMKRLYKYRNDASDFYNSNKEGEEKKSILKETVKSSLVELIDPQVSKINTVNFYEENIENENDIVEKYIQNPFVFAEEDIPRQSQTKKKTYDELMKVIKEFFEKEMKYELFLKLRAFIKNHFGE